MKPGFLQSFGVKLIDKLIVVQFLKDFLFALLCFILIFILVDLFENLDKFIDRKIGFGMVAAYYFYFIPEIIKLVMPVSMLLATLFTAGRMINFNEIVAVKNSGVSLLRFMVPFLFVGVIVTCLSIYFNNWMVPQANKKKFFIERNYLGKNISVAGLSRLYFQDSKNQLILIEQFKDIDLSAHKVNILVYSPDSLTLLVKRVDAEQMKWENGKWLLVSAVERDFQKETNGAVKFHEKIYADEIAGLNKINLEPMQIIKKQFKPDEMDYTELKQFIESQLKGGQDVLKSRIDFYSKISFSFSNLIVIIFGISISTGTKKRKGLAIQFAVSILVSFIYLGFVKISQTFGYNGDLDPLLTAWLANICFTVFGGVNLYLKNY